MKHQALLIALVVIAFIDVTVSIALIGKERKPRTAGDAAIAFVGAALSVWIWWTLTT